MFLNIPTPTNTGNNRRIAVSMRRPVNTPFKKSDKNIGETVFYAVRAKQTYGTIGRLLPGNGAVNTHS
jgi:hypothetical protein